MDNYMPPDKRLKFKVVGNEDESLTITTSFRGVKFMAKISDFINCQRPINTISPKLCRDMLTCVYQEKYDEDDGITYNIAEDLSKIILTSHVGKISLDVSVTLERVPNDTSDTALKIYNLQKKVKELTDMLEKSIEINQAYESRIDHYKYRLGLKKDKSKTETPKTDKSKTEENKEDKPTDNNKKENKPAVVKEKKKASERKKCCSTLVGDYCACYLDGQEESEETNETDED